MYYQIYTSLLYFLFFFLSKTLAYSQSFIIQISCILESFSSFFLPNLYLCFFLITLTKHPLLLFCWFIFLFSTFYIVFSLVLNNISKLAFKPCYKIFSSFCLIKGCNNTYNTRPHIVLYFKIFFFSHSFLFIFVFLHYLLPASHTLYFYSFVSCFYSAHSTFFFLHLTNICNTVVKPGHHIFFRLFF